MPSKRADLDESCCLSCMRVIVCMILTYGIIQITKILVTFIYVKDLEINGNVNNVLATLPPDIEYASSSDYFAMLIVCTIMYAITSGVFCCCIHIYQPYAWFGFLGSMFFWVSFLGSVSANAMIDERNTEFRCGGNYSETGCAYNSLKNDHLVYIGWVLIIPMVVGWLFIIFASVCETKHINSRCDYIFWYSLWYIFFPCGIFIISALSCICNDDTQILQNVNQSESSTVGQNNLQISTPVSLSSPNVGIETNTLQHYNQMI